MTCSRVACILLLLPALLAAQLTIGFVEGTVDTAAPTTIEISGGAGFHKSVVVTGRFVIPLPYGRYEFTVAGRPAYSVTVRGGETTPYGSAALVAEPLNPAGLADNRLAVTSDRGISWTRTHYTLGGMDATDSYQPGRPAIYPDVEALDEPERAWHGSLSTANTGSFLAWSNFPAPAERGLVRQSERFTAYTRDRIEAGGPLANWGDLIVSAAGQWSAQTVPLAAPGSEQHSRILYGDARSRIRAGERDQIELLYSGSSINLSDWGEPAGIEALAGGRMMPQFELPGGFAGLREHDRFDFAQTAWTRVLARALLQVRYGYSGARLDTTGAGGETQVELLGSAIGGAPPLANLATRTRHGVDGTCAIAAAHHQIAAGGGWQRSTPRNRFTASPELITAAGAPAFTVEFNTPTETRESVQSFSAFVTDRWRVTPAFVINAGLWADVSRGATIAWNSAAPRAGFAWHVPHSRGLILEGEYSRSYAPLAGRYLDFADPNSLGASIFLNGGSLVARFGGPYSSIDPSLRRPYADEFNVGAEIAPLASMSASIRLFRRDEKRRLAAVNVGVPASAFTPVTIAGEPLIVYQQSPATFGQDRYLLTNPRGLREQNEGIVAQLRSEWRRLLFHLSFAAEKSWGPTNPGDAVFENDPGVIGSLFADPNTLINATGHSFLDRAYVAKLQATYRLPAGIEVASAAEYFDGLPFGRQLMVTGLAQGPILVAATIRGSPEGGHRSEYVANWNLRVGRAFPLPKGRISAAVDVMNVTNAAQRLQESDVSGPAFNQRLPVAIQPPRFARVELRYEF